MSKTYILKEVCSFISNNNLVQIPKGTKIVVEEENKSNDSFQWTDALVKEFIIDRNNGKTYAPIYVDDYIKEFKQSHTPKPQAENSGFVLGVDTCRGDFKLNPSGAVIFKKDPNGEYEVMYRGRPENKEDFEAQVKKASSYYGANVLCEYCGEIGKHKENCTRPQADNKPDRDWEIIEFRTPFLGSNDVAFTRNKDGEYQTGLNGQVYTYTGKYLSEWPVVKIHSVKRISGV